MAAEYDWDDDRRRFREADEAERRGSGKFEIAQGPLAREFVALADLLFSVPADAGVQGLVERIVGVAHRVITGADAVSVLLRADGKLETVASSDELAVAIDALQREHGEGPALEATEADGIGAATSPDLGADDRWAGFGAAAGRAGIRAALSTGMFPGGTPPRFGALNFYAKQPDALGDDDRDHALVLAAHAATAIAGVRARTAAELQIAQLRTALESRDVIGQAKGILMERRGLDADAAFDVLRSASQDLNVKLRDVASTLVDRRSEL